jgi:hypothetical protein
LSSLDNQMNFFGIILDVSKMIPTAPFTQRVITMSQCPIRILDCRLNLRISLFHWSLSQSYDAWCKRRSMDDFRYSQSTLIHKHMFTISIKIHEKIIEVYDSDWFKFERIGIKLRH